MVQLKVNYINPCKCSICKQWCVERVTFDTVSICEDCERMMVQTDSTDKEYDHYIQELSETLKKI